MPVSSVTVYQFVLHSATRVVSVSFSRARDISELVKDVKRRIAMLNGEYFGVSTKELSPEEVSPKGGSSKGGSFKEGYFIGEMQLLW
eukprot:CAMPEP_0181118450 /NCGR_PEP_ID=MMETSP1071-20121207/23083_1 /TAXON_ID=35127 /ORGANISM="Thalassiosira sp., Strain NH16" /LENGTH=86 /DNA_ID=CAMNT_0023202947 /DNA_START=958 /DNA_END=1215 /DNA_ORIENTATION=-